MFCTSPAEGQGKVNKKNVVIKSFDGVELSATYYPNPTGKREATVILLHDFDFTRGGSSQSAGWNKLAAALQADGYAVMSFDFRGFGDSKTVDPMNFWAKAQNKDMVKKSNGGKAASIDFKNFQGGYGPYLLNDIAAIKAYLDRQNDNRDCNTASTIFIGAGSGAALGSLWLGHECHRRRDKNMQVIGGPMLAELEIKDVAAAVWVSPSAKVGPKAVSLGPSLSEACNKNKVPVAFVFGSLDSASDNLSTSLANRINGSAKKDKIATLKRITGTKLAGDKLIDALETDKWIVTALGKVMDDRGARERLDRKSLQSRYWYVHPGSKNNVPWKIQKAAGDEVGPVDLKMVFKN